MTDWVRVKDAATGHEYTTPRPIAARSAHLTVLDKPAVSAGGNPLPAKHHRPLSDLGPQRAEPAPGGDSPPAPQTDDAPAVTETHTQEDQE